jgi:hypothetical protein
MIALDVAHRPSCGEHRMADDVVIVCGDEPLRDVLAIALGIEHYRAWTAADEYSALDALAGSIPALLLLDAGIELSSDPISWADRYAPQTPTVLLVERLSHLPEPHRSDVILLELPFGHKSLLAVIAEARAARPERP